MELRRALGWTSQGHDNHDLLNNFPPGRSQTGQMAQPPASLVEGQEWGERRLSEGQEMPSPKAEGLEAPRKAERPNRRLADGLKGARRTHDRKSWASDDGVGEEYQTVGSTLSIKGDRQGTAFGGKEDGSSQSRRSL